VTEDVIHVEWDFKFLQVDFLIPTIAFIATVQILMSEHRLPSGFSWVMYLPPPSPGECRNRDLKEGTTAYSRIPSSSASIIISIKL